MCIRDRWKIVIPTTIEKDIILDYHLRYGHMGATKGIKAIEENCHIKNINRKTRNYIKTCLICQLVKTNNERKEGMMIPVSYTHLDVYKRQLLESSKWWLCSPGTVL